MLENRGDADGGVSEAERVAAFLAGRLRIELAGFVLGHVEIPADVEPARLPESLRFELKPPA
jgi:hypothetical protein